MSDEQDVPGDEACEVAGDGSEGAAASDDGGSAPPSGGVLATAAAEAGGSVELPAIEVKPRKRRERKPRPAPPAAESQGVAADGAAAAVGAEALGGTDAPAPPRERAAKVVKAAQAAGHDVTIGAGFARRMRGVIGSGV